MKISKIFLFALLCGVLAVTSCQKQGCTDSNATNFSADAQQDDGSCTFIPTITLNGDDTVTIAVGSNYVDAGATAVDQDGNSVTVITDVTAVDANEVGTYSVTYSAINTYGTATATRTVVVAVTPDVWINTTWDITDDCNIARFPLSSPPTIAAGATAADLEFTSFFSLVGGTATATISNGTITFPQQSISITGGTIDFSGTGTMNSAGTEFVVNFSYDNTVPLIGGSGTCTATYTAQ